MSGAATAPLLEARGVAKRLPEGATLVAGVDLSVRAGEFVAITGPSGGGKSSLLYLLGLLDRPTSGEMRLEGRPTADLDDAEMAATRLSRLGFVFQFHFLLPEFSALDNVLVPIRRLGRLTGRDAEARARGLLAALGLAGAERKMPDQLSGGMRQRVAIARALANDPAVILADEPTGNLDSRNAGAVFDLFAAAAARPGRAVVVVTHDPALAERASRRVRIVDGRVVADDGAGAGAHAAPGAPPPLALAVA